MGNLEWASPHSSLEQGAEWLGVKAHVGVFVRKPSQASSWAEVGLHALAWSDSGLIDTRCELQMSRTEGRVTLEGNKDGVSSPGSVPRGLRLCFVSLSHGDYLSPHAWISVILV